MYSKIRDIFRRKKLNDNLKEEYNYWLKRNSNAEIFFKDKLVEECLNHIELFNQITIKLSSLRNDLEKELKRKMTKEEILNGFRG